MISNMFIRIVNFEDEISVRGLGCNTRYYHMLNY